MTPEQALEFIIRLIDTKTVASKMDFVQAQQAIDILALALQPKEQEKKK